MNQDRVASSFIFKFIERLAVKGIGLVISVLLARMLDPEVFGLLAIINVFVNLAQTFVQTGLGTALVQNRTTREDDYSTVFYLSFGIAAVLTAALWVAAPFIGSYYQSDLLVWPLRVMGLSLLFAAFNSVQTAKLQREMRFKVMMHCNLLATVISGALGLAAAWLGWGLWALVVYHLSHVVAVSLCMLAVEKWLPRWVFSWQRAKVFFGYGWKLLASGLLCSLYYDIRALIVGKRYSTADLAYYNKAQQYPDLIARTLNESIQAVMLPVMASAQEDQERLNRILLRSISSAMFVVVPSMLGLAAVSDTLIPLLLTDKWAACVPLLKIFCLGNLMIPLQSSNLSLLKATGRSDVYMKTEIVRRVVMIATLLVTVFVFDSVTAIAIGYAAGYWLDAWIIVAQVKKLTGVGFARQLAACWKTFLAAALMAAAVYPLGLLPLGGVAKLAVQVIAGVAVYGLTCLLTKNEALAQAKSIAAKFFKKGKKKQ